MISGGVPSWPIDLLASAIARQEGFFVAGTRPQLNNNPGDLRYAGQLGAAVPVGYPDLTPAPIAEFEKLEYGVVAIYRQLWLCAARGLTVQQTIYEWAPPNENNSTAYLADVIGWTGLPADAKILDLMPPLAIIPQPAAT